MTVDFPLSELVICTKDRPKELLHALRSVGLQSSPPRRVLVVDSSANSDSQEVVLNIKKSFAVEIEIIKSDPGLTHQRNIAIQNLLSETSLVHFIDDDVVLHNDYLENIVQTFLSHPNAVGVGGAIENLPSHKVRLIRRLLGIASKIQGVVLKNGLNVMNSLPGVEHPSMWLSGCSMSFRKRILENVLFDERRTGNGMGEDVDFCLRASKFGPLVWTPSARLVHEQSPINRLDYFRTRKAVLRHRQMLAKDGLAGVTGSRVVMSEFLEAIASSLKAARFHDLTRVRAEISYLLSLFAKR